MIDIQTTPKGRQVLWVDPEGLTTGYCTYNGCPALEQHLEKENIDEDPLVLVDESEVFASEVYDLSIIKDRVKELYNRETKAYPKRQFDEFKASIMWKDDLSSYPVIFKFGKEASDEDDDRYFYHVSDINELYSLLEKDNGEDFIIIEFDMFDYYRS